MIDKIKKNATVWWRFRGLFLFFLQMEDVLSIIVAAFWANVM